ncbi:MAG: FG-GAP repeat domain-containing protein [Desulfopila sp.]
MVLLLGATVGFFSLRDGGEKYGIEPTGVEVPRYTTMDVDFHHAWDASRGLPYTAGAVIDIDNDGTEELFIGGGLRQSDGLFRFEEGRFINVVNQVGLVKQGDAMTLGAAVLDIDGNGYDDLIVSRETGIWLYSNNNGTFTSRKLDIDMPPNGVPLAAALADINGDGHFDMVVPFVQRTGRLKWLAGKARGVPVGPRLYINDGDNSFFESTEAAGLAHAGEARQALFVDLDDDTAQDLVMLHTDGRLSTWHNLGDLLFDNKPHFHTSRNGHYMGLAPGDYDGDGRVDFLLTNRGATYPKFLDMLSASGVDTISQWTLMKNVGFFSFRDDGASARLADYEMARGALFTDLNDDGRRDLVVSQNHPSWPPYMLKKLRLPGRMLVQNDEGKFAAVGKRSGLDNRAFSITPLRGDFNGDGRPDIVFVNIDGPPLVLLSKAGNNNYLNIALPNTVESLGAIVYVRKLSGKTLKVRYMVGTELCSDSSHVLHVGLGRGKATDVLVEYADGRKDQTSGVLYNTTVVFE